MRDVREIVKKISEKTGKDVKELEEEIDEIVSSYEGVLSRETAAYLLARKYAVKLAEDVESFVIKPSELDHEVRRANVLGAVRELRERRDGTLELAIYDGKVVARCFLNAMSVKRGELFRGRAVLLKNAKVSVKSGRVTLSLNSKSEVVLDPLVSTKDLIHRSRRVKLRLTLEKIVGEVLVEGRGGIVYRIGGFVGSDEAGLVFVKLWDEACSVLDELKVGDLLSVLGERISLRNGFFEVHVNDADKVSLLGERRPRYETQYLKPIPLNKVEPGMFFVDVVAFVDKVLETDEYAGIILSKGGARVPLILEKKKFIYADLRKSIKEGEGVLLQNVNVVSGTKGVKLKASMFTRARRWQNGEKEEG